MNAGSKTHWKRLQNPDYLGAYALSVGEEPVLTIKSVGRERVKGEGGREEECTVAHFAESGFKPMVLNATNSKTITKIYGSPYIEDWVGKRIQIFATTTSLKGEKVECLRIRPKEPVSTLPELSPAHQKWGSVIQKMVANESNLDAVRRYFELSQENELLLLQEVDRAKA